MRLEYKNAFNRLSISDEANRMLLQIPQEKAKIKTSGFFLKHSIMKLVYAAIIIAVLSVPTIKVLAGVDFGALFKGLFKEKSEFIVDYASQPEVIVTKNTFEDIDISIKGITGDKSLIYVLLEVTRKDGSAFEEADYDFAYKFIDLKKKIETFDEDPLSSYYKELAQIEDEDDGKDSDTSNSKNKNKDLKQDRADHFVMLDDEVLSDNIITFAYVANIETEIDGVEYFIPRETFEISLGNLKISEDQIIEGSWEAEFIADYTPSDEIYVNVDKPYRMPTCLTDDEYLEENEWFLYDFTLSNVALRYNCNYSYWADVSRTTYTWKKLYIEMKDGSIVGKKYFDDERDGIRSGTSRMGWLGGSGDTGEPFTFRWLFAEPIDIKQVKAVHIGDLTIKIN
jgi:hypothetical protein